MLNWQKLLSGSCKNWKFHSCSRSGLCSKFRLWVLIRFWKKSLTPARIDSGTPAPCSPLVDSVTLFKSAPWRVVASVTNANSLTYSTNVLVHNDELFQILIALLSCWIIGVSQLVSLFQWNQLFGNGVLSRF